MVDQVLQDVAALSTHNSSRYTTTSGAADSAYPTYSLPIPGDYFKGEVSIMKLNSGKTQLQQRIRIMYTPLFMETEQGQTVNARVVHQMGRFDNFVENEPVLKYVVLAITRTRKKGEKVGMYLVIGDDEGKFETSLDVTVSRRSVQQVFGKETTLVRVWKGSGQENVPGDFNEFVISDVVISDLKPIEDDIQTLRNMRSKGLKTADEQNKLDDELFGSSFGSKSEVVPAGVSDSQDEPDYSPEEEDLPF